MAQRNQDKSFFLPQSTKGENEITFDIMNNKALYATTFNIMHQNIQPMPNKLDQIEIFLETLDKRVDALAITEHWLNAAKLTFIRLAGFRMASCYARENRIHGGSCLLVREGISFVECVDLKEKSIETVIECSAIEVIVEKLLIINIYRPPSGDIDVFLTAFTDIMESATRKCKHNVVITGDFNINFQDKDQTNTRNFQNLLNSFNLNVTIHKPTRVTSTSSTTVDNIFTDHSDYTSDVIASGLSDHFAQIILIPARTIEAPKLTYEQRRIVNTNALNTLAEKLSMVEWNFIENESNLNICYRKQML
ncbi:Endonuclease-reverse transcriptase [Popillia japonica]|uniref:Endonuclease-reverse transcriptase n=1 Tax=Popillia japonica TaxID=7064 RepID=A0AAW1K241_POPJA